MARYNGHHCWNCWNVALWIGNDEGLYRFALDCIRENKGRKAQAEAFIAGVQEFGEPGKAAATPDGAKYTLSAVMAALRGLES